MRPVALASTISATTTKASAPLSILHPRKAHSCQNTTGSAWTPGPRTCRPPSALTPDDEEVEAAVMIHGWDSNVLQAPKAEKGAYPANKRAVGFGTHDCEGDALQGRAQVPEEAESAEGCICFHVAESERRAEVLQDCCREGRLALSGGS